MDIKEFFNGTVDFSKAKRGDIVIDLIQGTGVVDSVNVHIQQVIVRFETLIDNRFVPYTIEGYNTLAGVPLTNYRYPILYYFVDGLPSLTRAPSKLYADMLPVDTKLIVRVGKEEGAVHYNYATLAQDLEVNGEIFPEGTEVYLREV